MSHRSERVCHETAVAHTGMGNSEPELSGQYVQRSLYCTRELQGYKPTSSSAFIKPIHVSGMDDT